MKQREARKLKSREAHFRNTENKLRNKASWYGEKTVSQKKIDKAELNSYRMRDKRYGQKSKIVPEGDSFKLVRKGIKTVRG